jgi:putative acetyltransferase
MTERRIERDDPRAPDVRALLERHLEFCHQHTAPQDVSALDVDALLDPGVSFFSCREDGALLGVGALKRLDQRHAEIKSMHTAREARGRGVARELVAFLVDRARSQGFERISLETGSMAAFAPARALYASAGFEPCERFADYPDSPTSAFMTLDLGLARS